MKKSIIIATSLFISLINISKAQDVDDERKKNS